MCCVCMCAGKCVWWSVDYKSGNCRDLLFFAKLFVFGEGLGWQSFAFHFISVLQYIVAFHLISFSQKYGKIGNLPVYWLKYFTIVWFDFFFNE